MQVIRGCQEIENASFRQRRCFVTADRFQEIGVVLPAFDFGVCILSARGGADPDRLLSVRWLICAPSVMQSGSEQ